MKRPARIRLDLCGLAPAGAQFNRELAAVHHHPPRSDPLLAAPGQYNFQNYFLSQLLCRESLGCAGGAPTWRDSLMV
jgi:hypothetical protein